MGFEPTPPKRLELESSALDRSAIQAWRSCQNPRWISLFFARNGTRKKNKAWSIGVSIPVPRACKARTLPIELMPQLAALAGN